MQNLPPHEELAKLSNDELMKRIKSLTNQLKQAAKHGEAVSQKEQVFQAYETERLKRLDLMRKGLKNYFD